jgi:hypothetical protein
MSLGSSRYPLVGGTRQRHFDGTNFMPRKTPENAQTPTTMAPTIFVGDLVHALLGGFICIERFVSSWYFLPLHIHVPSEIGSANRNHHQ